MMQGRKLLKYLNPILNTLSWCYKILPNFITQFLWDLSSIFSGKLFMAFRYILLKSKAQAVGNNVYIGKYTVFKNIKHLQIGNNVSIHDFCYIDAEGGIIIGDNISIAHGCSILSAEHTWDDNNVPIKYNPIKYKPTILKNDIWIGSGVKILGGVIINSRSIIAAGAVVNRDVLNNTLVGGVPIKDLKNI